MWSGRAGRGRAGDGQGVGGEGDTRGWRRLTAVPCCSLWTLPIPPNLPQGCVGQWIQSEGRASPCAIGNCVAPLRLCVCVLMKQYSSVRAVTLGWAVEIPEARADDERPTQRGVGARRVG